MPKTPAIFAKEYAALWHAFDAAAPQLKDAEQARARHDQALREAAQGLAQRVSALRAAGRAGSGPEAFKTDAEVARWLGSLEERLARAEADRQRIQRLALGAWALALKGAATLDKSLAAEIIARQKSPAAKTGPGQKALADLLKLQIDTRKKLAPRRLALQTGRQALLFVDDPQYFQNQRDQALAAALGPAPKTASGAAPAKTSGGTAPAKAVSGPAPAETTGGTLRAKTGASPPPARTASGGAPAKTAAGTPPANTAAGTPPAKTVSGTASAKTVSGPPPAKSAGGAAPAKTASGTSPAKIVGGTLPARPSGRPAAASTPGSAATPKTASASATPAAGGGGASRSSAPTPNATPIPTPASGPLTAAAFKAAGRQARKLVFGIRQSVVTARKAARAKKRRQLGYARASAQQRLRSLEAVVQTYERARKDTGDAAILALRNGRQLLRGIQALVAVRARARSMVTSLSKLR